MTIAFILKFQEDCTAGSEADAKARTMTITQVHSEQPDSDPASTSFSALRAGTTTNTRVAVEHGDKDQTSGSSIIPRRMLEMGTTTMTFVQAEMTDKDYGRTQHRILPRCS